MEPIMRDRQNDSPILRSVLRWEGRFMAAELVGVACGLYLLLRLQWTVLGLVALFGTATLSLLVRAHHYQATQRPVTNTP